MTERFEVHEDGGRWIVWDRYLARPVETGWAEDGVHLDAVDAEALAENCNELEPWLEEETWC